MKVPFIPVTLASTVENKKKFVALISYCGFTITSAPELLIALYAAAADTWALLSNGLIEP